MKQTVNSNKMSHRHCKQSCNRFCCLWTFKLTKKKTHGTSMLWRKPTNHEKDCYFCVTNTSDFKRKAMSGIVYEYAKLKNPV